MRRWWSKRSAISAQRVSRTSSPQHDGSHLGFFKIRRHLAQWLERTSYNQRDPGSNPGGGHLLNPQSSDLPRLLWGRTPQEAQAPHEAMCAEWVSNPRGEHCIFESPWGIHSGIESVGNRLIRGSSHSGVDPFGSRLIRRWAHSGVDSLGSDSFQVVAGTGGARGAGSVADCGHQCAHWVLHPADQAPASMTNHIFEVSETIRL